MGVEPKIDLSKVKFGVEQRPILVPANDSKLTRIPHFSAIVDVEREHVFSIVSDEYRLITNDQAIAWGELCFRQIFKEYSLEGMRPFNIRMPSTRSFCHIDFIHEEVAFLPWEDDPWLPFLRVTNSYNRTKLLGFDLGFCRWICKNGMIFDKQSITFQFVHTRNQVDDTIEFHTSFGELKQLVPEFIEKLHSLKCYYVPDTMMLAIVCRVFGINVKREDMSRLKRRDELRRFRNHANSLIRSYFDEFGPTAYAALNVLTDLASRPLLGISPEAMMDHLQKRTGEWVDDFIQQVKSEKFDFEEYVRDYLESAEFLRAC